MQRSETHDIESSFEMMNIVLLSHKSSSSLITELPHWEDGSVGMILFSLTLVVRIQLQIKLGKTYLGYTIEQPNLEKGE